MAPPPRPRYADSSPNLNSILVASTDQDKDARALTTLSEEGAVILKDCVAPDALAHCRVPIDRITQAILSAAAAAASQGQGFDDPKVLDAKVRRTLGITRIAQIGEGKKNVHFDPYYPSPAAAAPENGESGNDNHAAAANMQHPHGAMEALAEGAGVAALIRAYCGEDVTLAETGLSITRPGGCGLEWHADGREGECTVIMSLDDIPVSMGTLQVIRKSHVMLDRDTSEDFDADILAAVGREEKKEGGDGVVSYAYRAGQPIVFDARTLHAAGGSSAVEEEEEREQGAEGNQRERTSSAAAYRVILWWIYNGQV